MRLDGGIGVVSGFGLPCGREDAMRLQGSSDRRGWLVIAVVLVIVAILAYFVVTTIL